MGVILIAFERESEQSALEQLLSGRGHRVVKSGNGLAALDNARREPPQAVVSDIVLPRMDGFALCRKWKQDERLQSIPFVFYTRRHDDPKYERFALELGAERFLARSTPPEKLLTTLEELLGEVGAKSSPSVAVPAPATAAAQRSAAATNAQQARTEERARQAQARLQARVAELEGTNERLAAGEARFRHVFEANPLPMWITDRATGGFIAVNDAALLLHGYSRAEFLALRAVELEMPDADQVAGTRAHRRKDGAALALSATSQDIEFDGRSAHLVCAYDLTDRLAAERVQHRELAAQRTVQRQLEFLVELSGQSETLDEATIVRRAVEQAALATGSPLAWLHYLDAGHGTLQLAGWCDDDQWHATVSAEPLSLSQSAAFAECVRAKRAASSNDPGLKKLQDGLPDLQRYLAVPVMSGEEVSALLGVANRAAAYVEEDEELLIGLARAVGRIVQAKRTNAQTLRSLQRTDVALQGMIDAFVRMSERHDPYTAGSSRRLAALAVALGREAGLDGERQHALRIAALLHDIGNIAVPASILSRPGPLAETELALMRTHVEAGCQLLADIDFGAPIADIIYQSHERCDGSGYPRGLKGEDILLEARILAIADTVEAMCSPRPHRPAAGMEAAIDEINRGAGRLYDPQLAAACTRLVKQHGFSVPE